MLANVGTSVVCHVETSRKLSKTDPLYTPPVGKGHKLCLFPSVCHADWRSLDADSAATLVHAFVTSRVDYCNAILAAAPKTTTDRLQRVLNAATRVVSDTKKFDQGLSRLMHQELHWLDIPERVNYKLGVLTHRCLLGKAPV